MDKYKHFNSENEPLKFSCKKNWQNYAEWLRGYIKTCLALNPMPKPCRLKPLIFDKFQGDSYTCEKVCFQSLPGFFVTGNLFRPLDAEKKSKSVPAILNPHGHWRNGRLHDLDNQVSVVARCIHFAKMGATVFTWDMIGFNDSCQIKEHRAFPDDPLWGLSLASAQTWNSIRALDFVLSLPEVDPDRVGITGASGGATQTFLLCAVDERITAAAPVCMISSHMQGGCLCENAPLLRIHASNVEIAALHAPKPMFIGSCTGDWTKNVPEKELPAIASIYRLYNAEHQVAGYHVNDIHNYNRDMYEHVAGFFNRHLFGKTESSPVKAHNYAPPPLRDMMVWWGRIPPDPVSNDDFIELWRKHVLTGLNPHLVSPSITRNRLGPLFPNVLGLPDTPVEQKVDLADYIVFQKKNDTLNVSLTRRDRKSRRTLPDNVKSFYTTYNLPDAALETVAILDKIRSMPDVRCLAGTRDAGIHCLAAAALSPQIKQIEVDVRGFDPELDDDWTKFYEIPCIRQIGGMAVILSLIRNREVKLNNAADKMMKLVSRYTR